jgi:hypothetical protein
MYICSYMRSFLPQVLYAVWCLSKLYAHKNNCKKTCGKNTTALIGTNVKVRGFNAGLLARSQFASGRSCDQPTRSRFYVVFLGPRANAELVSKFHVALHASHVALPMVTSKFSPCTDVTLGWIALFMGDMGEGALQREDEVTVKQRMGARHQDELADRPSVAI